MKITVNRAAFAAALGRVSSPSKGIKGSLPILSGALLTARDGRIELRGTDLETGVITSIDATVHQPGETVIPVAKAVQVVAAAAVDSVNIEEQKNHRIAIRADEYLVHLAGMEATEFPRIAGDEQADEITLEASDLQGLVSACLHAVSNDEKRYVLTGIYLRKEGEVLTAVATNGHRLALAGRRLPLDASAVASGVIIPRKGLEEIRKLDDSAVRLRIGTNCIELHQDDTSVYIRLIDGEFPDYRRVIPAGDGYHVATVDGRRLLDAVKRVALISEKGLKLRIEAKFLILSGTKEGDEAADSIPCSYSGPGIDLCLLSRYLTDVLASFPEGDVFLKVKSSTDPVVLVPGSYAGWDERLAIIMPMRF